MRQRMARPGAASSPQPSTAYEQGLVRQGRTLIAGVDEVGRGCLAGPVVAAAVILPSSLAIDPAPLFGVRDSKQLTAPERERLAHVIHTHAIGIGLGIVDAAEIDQRGIVAATRDAMLVALWQLPVVPQHILLDYEALPELTIEQTSITRGDTLCLSIAAASVVAKVARDALMVELDRDFSAYGFARNKGYGTPEHVRALAERGPTRLHRRSFAPVRVVVDAYAFGDHAVTVGLPENKQRV